MTAHLLPTAVTLLALTILTSMPAPKRLFVRWCPKVLRVLLTYLVLLLAGLVT